MALPWGVQVGLPGTIQGDWGGVLTETSKPIFSICQSTTLGTQVRSMCRGEEGRGHKRRNHHTVGPSGLFGKDGDPC